MKHLLTIAIYLILFTGCKKTEEPIQSVQKTPTFLTGTKWFRDWGLFPGYTQIAQFTEDSLFFNMSKDGAITDQGIYVYTVTSDSMLSMGFAANIHKGERSNFNDITMDKLRKIIIARDSFWMAHPYDSTASDKFWLFGVKIQ